MKNNGKEAERAFHDHWFKVGHVERLRDKQDLVALNRGLRLADFAKPSDFIVSSPDVALHYAEVKSTTNPTMFSFAKIRPAQSAAALKEHTRGKGSYVFYIFSYALSQWLIMTCDHYARLLDAGRRSVKFEELVLWLR